MGEKEREKRGRERKGGREGRKEEREMGGKETRMERRSTSANIPTAIHQQGKKCSITTGRIIFRKKTSQQN